MQNVAVLSDEDLEGMNKVGFSPVEIAEVEQFAAPFSKTGRTYLAMLFIRARLMQKGFDETMAVAKALWDETWKHGSPDRIGDADDVSEGRGFLNTCAFLEGYKRLGFAYPQPKFLF